MAHAFDSEGFGHVVADIERLVARLSNHERGVAALSDLIERDGGAVAATIAAAGAALATLDGAGASAVASDRLGDLLRAMQELLASAQEQRRLAETVRDRLASTAGTAAPGNGNGTRRPLVLVVDDSQDNRDVAALLLESSGFDAITASNGLEGVIVAHNTRPAVVLMDVAMPILDGIQATRLLRASPVTQGINVIAHTARADLDSIAMARLFESVLPKPASPDTMLEVVQRYSASHSEL